MEIILKLMNSPIAWVINFFFGFAGFIGVILSIVFYFRSKKGQRLYWARNSYRIYEKSKANIENLELQYNNEKVEDLVITKIAIWNSGSRKIEKDDIYPDGIRITSKEASILNATALPESKKNEHLDFMDNRLVFESIKKKDGIVIRVLHTGNPKDIRINGEFKDDNGKIKRYDLLTIESIQSEFGIKWASERLVIVLISVLLSILFMICTVMIVAFLIEMIRVCIGYYTIDMFATDIEEMMNAYQEIFAFSIPQRIFACSLICFYGVLIVYGLISIIWDILGLSIPHQLRKHIYMTWNLR